MKFLIFQRQMKKEVFSTAEAQVVAHREDPALINLQLHQWEKQGLLTRLKRGAYYFSDRRPSIENIVRALYMPSYFSLEYVLSRYGILPEAAFSYTLVTTKTTRKWQTPLGLFSFRKIKKEAFSGYDPQSLMAEKEKGLVDYFYLNRFRLLSDNAFWESSRMEAIATDIRFKKVFQYARLFRSKKLEELLRSFESYAKSEKMAS